MRSQTKDEQICRGKRERSRRKKNQEPPLIPRLTEKKHQADLSLAMAPLREPRTNTGDLAHKDHQNQRNWNPRPKHHECEPRNPLLHNVKNRHASTTDSYKDRKWETEQRNEGGWPTPALYEPPRAGQKLAGDLSCRETWDLEDIFLFLLGKWCIFV